MGAYCTDGVVYDCPAGKYGRAERLESSDCSGPCQKGYFCPPGSTSRVQMVCPAGYYGSEEGLGTSECSGSCERALDCPPGSTSKSPNLRASSW